MKAIRIHETGGPEVLLYEDVATPTPGAGQVLVKVTVVGVNYADVMLSRGMAHGMRPVQYPITPGFEVVGTVAALGAGVTALAEGTRVAAVLEDGGYAEYAVVDVASVVKIPEGVDDAQATALLVQGITAYGLLHDAVHIQASESVLVQAAAGGVGTLAIQLAKLAGAGTIVGTAGSAEKRELAQSLGASVTIDYGQDGWVKQVFDATGGCGVDTVLESIGGKIGGQALQCLAPLGRLVSFGGASGQPMPSFDLMQMNIKGLTVSGYGGPWLRPGRAQAAREAIAGYLIAHQLKVVVGQTFPLAEAANAHRALMGRGTMGKVLLSI